ncbi:MAG: hypothetical protein KA347_04570 [Bacteroidia bacterium]|jgi:hypothetical protein|nr:hypothetical protein [Bacteroidota bacterium]MBP6511920.1 hypothetical protein [Bacteroidia bacterium]MBP7244877.1 hypothetical protein [Bacteroidia bacterium]
MRNRIFILLPLMVAYLLMLSHDVIPHHHHETLVEAEQHHAIEHADHHHHDGTTGAHEHTMHFVHSPDFGNYIPSSNFSIDDVALNVLSFSVIELSDFFSSIQPDESPKKWHDDNPPPLLNKHSSSFHFRGPPKLLSFA